MKRGLLFLCLAGCSWGTISPGEFKKEFGVSAEKTEVNVFSEPGMSLCLAKLRAAVGTGEVHAVEIELEPSTMKLSARNAACPRCIDVYPCRYGEVDPSAIQRGGAGAATSSVEDDTFLLSDVDFDVLPSRLDGAPGDAQRDLGIAGGVVTWVEIRKFSAAEKVSVQVQVNGPQKHGKVEYDGKGVRVPRSIAALHSLPGGRVHRGDLADVTIPPGSWRAFDAPELPPATALDPLGQRDWAVGVAAAWKSDAVLYGLSIDNRPFSGGTLAPSDWKYWFVSPSCLASNGPGPCGLQLRITPSTYSSVNVSMSDVSGPHDPIGTVGCSLRDAYGALRKRDPAFVLDSVVLSGPGSKLRWTFSHNESTSMDLGSGKSTHDPGKKLFVDAATCMVVTKVDAGAPRP